MSSIFTRIINREIPASIVYEDDICIAILDIDPVQKGHTLVIPKQELAWMDDYDDVTVAHCMIVTKKLMKHMKTVLADIVVVYLIVEWLEVPHWHTHVIPYTQTPNHSTGVTKQPYALGEQDQYLQLLHTDLSQMKDLS